MQIEILNGLTARQFLAEYWQKKPLLIRNAFLGFRDFVSGEMLQSLAQQADVQSRLVSEREGLWEVQQGPLTARDFKRVKRARWSLLVQGLEQWLPAGDTVDMEIEGIGKLSNTIVKDDTEFSILAKKKL